MPGKRYEARDKRVQKMSRNGLTEENLHSGERKRISNRPQEAPFVSDVAEQSHSIQETEQSQATGSQQRRFSPAARTDVASPQAESRAQSLRTDASQPVAESVQRMEQPPLGHDQERPTLEMGGQDLTPLSVNHTSIQFLHEGGEKAAAQVVARKQKVPYPTNRASAQSSMEADQTQPQVAGGTTAHIESGEHDAMPPPNVQQGAMPDGFLQTEAETVQDQPITPTVISAVPDTDTEQPKFAEGQDAQEPDEDALIPQDDMSQGNNAGRLSEHSSRMTSVRDTSMGRAAVQTAAEMRHSRKKKKVQSGYRQSHAEDTIENGQEGANVDPDQEMQFKSDVNVGEDTDSTEQDESKFSEQSAPDAVAEDGNNAGAPATVQKQHQSVPKTAGAVPLDGVSPTDTVKPESVSHTGKSPYRTAIHQTGDALKGTSGPVPDKGRRQGDKGQGGQTRRHDPRSEEPLSQEDTGTKKKSSRLSFDDEENGMVRGAGMGIGRKVASAAAGTVTGYVHTKIHSVERDNSAVEGAHKAEILGENSIHKAVSRFGQRRKRKKKTSRIQNDSSPPKKGNRLQFTPTESAEAAGAAVGDKTAQASAAKSAAKEVQNKKSLLNRFWQKKRYKEAYSAARKGKTASGAAAKATQTAGSRAKTTVQSIFRKNKGIFIGIGCIGLFVLIFGAILSSCTALMQGTQNTFISSTYPSEDDAIYAAENAYLALEEELNNQINNIESSHSGYDEYNYQIDEISHNPYQLISYLTAKFEEFTYGQVAGEVHSLFTQQYELILSEVMEIRTRTVTDPETGEETEEEYEYWILNVTLINHGFDSVARSNMDSDQAGRYTLYNTTYGNRSYLFDTATLPTYTGDEGGFGYEIPAEALTDERFARMIAEAEKYLGYPYVWGGSSPSTSFDCSGFVCWVINNCGNGWNVGRTTANGLRSHCAYVSPEEAQPSDLIFFQGTYNTTGASHVGIYVGNGMMIHCGDPVQYTSVQTSYWQSHFLAYGRIQ